MPVRFVGGGTSGGSPIANPLDAFSLGINVAEAANTTPTDATSIALTVPETNAVPVETVQLAFTVPETSSTPTETARLAFTVPDTIAAQTETDTFAISLTQSETNPAPSETSAIAITAPDTISTATDAVPTLSITAPETVSAQTDNSTFVINLLQSETNPTPSETASFAFTIPESTATPIEAFTDLGHFWHTSQTNTGSSGITNPGNVTGVKDGAFAVLKTVTLGTNPISITATTGNSTNIPNGTPYTNATYMGYYKFSSGTTSTFTVTANWTGGSKTIETGSSTVDHSSTPISVDLFAAGMNTLAKAQSLTVTYQVSDTVAGLGGTFSVDAASLDITGIF